jgi:hypothetical protein
LAHQRYLEAGIGGKNPRFARGDFEFGPHFRSPQINVSSAWITSQDWPFVSEREVEAEWIDFVSSIRSDIDLELGATAWERVRGGGPPRAAGKDNAARIFAKAGYQGNLVASPVDAPSPKEFAVFFDFNINEDRWAVWFVRGA